MSTAPSREAICEALNYHIRRTELGYSERFEEDAERFYRETGFMAPGKSVPSEMWQGQAHEESRQAAWNEWTGRMRVEFLALLRSAVAALGGES